MTYTIQGSYGTFTVNEQGEILQIEFDEDPGNYGDIVSFDTKEYIEHYGQMNDTDILLIGYTTKDGRYEPPVDEQRKLVQQEQSLVIPGRVNQMLRKAFPREEDA